MNLFELGILDGIAEIFRCAPLDFIMPKITLLGEGGIAVILLAIILICIPKTRRTGFMVGAALLMGLIVCNIILKPVIARPRPYDVRGIMPYLASVQSDFSFPSGHTIACFECATVLFIRYRKWGIAALVVAALVSFSRMYLYLHYPSDVMVSIVLGVFFGWLACVIINKIYARWFDNKDKNKDANAAL